MPHSCLYVQNLPAVWDTWVQSLSWEDLLEKGMATFSIFLPGEFHGQRSPVGYSPWGCRESDTTKWLTLSFSSMSSPSTQCNSPSEQCWSELWVQNKESPGRHRINKILPSYGGLPLFNWENDIWSLLCSDYSMKNESHEMWISRAWRFYSYEESHILNA